MPSKKSGGDEQMHLHCRPFRWPCGGLEAGHTASTNAAWPGLSWKPHYWLRIAPAAARATANKTKVQNISTLLTILMAVAVHRYYTPHITRWSRSMAFIKVTKRHHLESTCFDRHQWDMPTSISGVYFIVKSLEKSSSYPNNNRGVTHQTDEHLNNMSEYFVGVVNIAFNHYNNCFLWSVINQKSP